ncbi:MAG: hypothetical protein KY443_06990 [Actinobacteria bacterium]|nr:hypothetical protein [Actinomycetota bacterium]
MTVLGERLRAVHAALDAAAIPHAFGGAIALAYCTADPRGTTDLDVNVFVPPTESERVLAALPDEVAVRPEDRLVLARDGQVRLWWARTPLDVFLDVHEFHTAVARGVRLVPFEGIDIPVLDCVGLAVFKAMFSRGKDWVDIEAMVDAASLDVPAAAGWLERILGADHDATTRLAALVQSEA